MSAAGLVAGLLGAALVAAFAGALADAFSGVGQEVFNAGVLALAVVMLAWHNIWMASHGREMAANLRQVGQAVAEGSKSMTALAIVVAVAVLREGSEVVLFLYGIAASGTAGFKDLLIGGMFGLALGCALSLLMFFGLVAIPARHLFAVTTTLITFLAAGMAAQCVVFLQQAGFVTALSGTLWDTSAILPDDIHPGPRRPCAVRLCGSAIRRPGSGLCPRAWRPFSSPPGWRRPCASPRSLEASS